jgi:hypothetical protein
VIAPRVMSRKPKLNKYIKADTYEKETHTERTCEKETQTEYAK